MGFITSILSVLGLIEADAPLVERLLGGLGQFVAQMFAGLFGKSAANALTAVVTHAENLVADMDSQAAAAEKFVIDYYSDLKTLVAQNPGLAQHLYVAYNLAADHGIPMGTAQKIAQIGHANVRIINAGSKTAA